MAGYDETTYGERIAEVYDSLYPEADPRAIVLLAELAHGGRALELGVGTGRFALPLRAAGVEVDGIDSSPSMVAKLREKASGAAVRVWMGDFAGVDVDGEYALIFVVFSTFFALPTQEEQVRCFENVARGLGPRGVFVIEAFVPDPTLFSRGQRVSAPQVERDQVMLDVSRYDAATQRVVSQRVVMTEAGVRLLPVQIRFVWPSELDLMARIAGLRLRERWAGWGREPFGAEATRHVSVYERQ